MRSLSIRILVENTCIKRNMLGQHGLSMIINYNGEKYIFDVGKIAEGLIYNMKSMKIEMDTIKGIIISHRDSDHCGSLPEVIGILRKQPIFITPDFDTKKFAYKHFIKVDTPREIEKDLFIIGPLSNNKKCQEQSIAIDLGKKGLVLLVGCSHPGIEHIIAAAQKATGNMKIMGIIGGLHLIEMKAKERAKHIAYLKSLALDFILPGHCTGDEAIQEMKKEFGDKVKTSGIGGMGAGSVIKIIPKIHFDINR